MRKAVFPPELAEAVAATGFSPAVRAGDFIFLTGATGGLPDGTMPATAAEQTDIALGKVAMILEDGTFERVAWPEIVEGLTAFGALDRAL